MDKIVLVILVVPAVLTFLAQCFADTWLTRIETLAARIAIRKRAIMVAAGVTPIALRLLLLPWLPVPVPNFHDEFSYLLAADTFCHWRLTNPPHPLWVFFDTFHVLGFPTYASIYPPAQGMILAIGQFISNPWIGVLLSIGLMCAAITWAIQGWLPSRWALLGSVLVVLRLGITSYWMDSYWGGAVAAMGGALVIGALPRLRRHPNVRDSLLMGLGAALLANSRPVEGFFFCLPVGVALFAYCWSGRRIRCRVMLQRAILPAVVIVSATAPWMAYYNWRVTGNTLLFPHVLYHRLYWDFPIFVWQSAKPALTYQNPQFTAFFSTWARTEFLDRSWLELCRTKVLGFWIFFLGPTLTIPLIALPWAIRDRRIRFLLIQFVWCSFWLLSMIWFEAHYAAPLTATIFMIIVRSIRHLRTWRFRSTPVGVLATRLVLIMVCSATALWGIAEARSSTTSWQAERARIVNQLNATDDRHLLIVHYDPMHNPHQEWVYNAADIDNSKIVWAREIPGRDLQPLLNYYCGRKVWMLEADARPAHLEPYSDGCPNRRSPR